MILTARKTSRIRRIGATGVLSVAVCSCSPSSEGPERRVAERDGGSGGTTMASASPASTSARGGTSTGPMQPLINLPPASTGTGGTTQTCGSVDVQAEPRTTETTIEVPANVLFVFDQSASMNEAWNGTPKWQVANDAIIAAFEPLQARVSAGAILYPTPSANAPAACNWATDWLACLTMLAGGGNLCPDVAPITTPPQIPLQKGTAFLTAWRGLWSAANAATGSGTPTEKALLQGEASLASPPPGNTVLTLVTDGQPTCGGNESAIARRLLAKSIKTYVVGLPGALGSAVLDAIAIAGGTAPTGCSSNCYLSPADPGSLQRALSSIATETVTTETVATFEQCEFALMPPNGANASDVHLIVTDSASHVQYEVPRNAADGWTLSADGRTASITGSVCALAKTGAYTNFSFQYGCVTAAPLPPR